MVENVTENTLEPDTDGTTAGTGADTGTTAKSSATDRLREEAGKLGSQAAERARAYAGEGKDRAADALSEVSKLMDDAAVQVDAKLGEEYGKYARSAAQGLSGFADSLKGKEVDDLIEDATALVRKSPVIAIGTAAAIGFALARLIKSGIDAASDLGDAGHKGDDDGPPTTSTAPKNPAQ